MARALPTRGDLSGHRFGSLVVVCRSDKRGTRGARTVPLWECRCDCGNITYKATDTLTGQGRNMCSDCAAKYAASRMRAEAGYVDGTQISRLSGDRPNVTGSSGARGVYLDRKTGKWRARLRFKGRLMDFGSFVNFEDALKARKEAEREYYGEYLLRQNQPIKGNA